MKIADYGKAITSYIESPTTAQKLQAKEKAQTLGRTFLAEGSEDIVEPPKSMQVDTTTKGPDLFTLDKFKDKAEIYILALNNRAMPLKDIKSALNKFTKQGLNDGTFTVDEAIKVVQNLKFEVQDRAQKQRLRDNIIAGTGTLSREEEADGGRIKLFAGGILADIGYSREKLITDIKRGKTLRQISEGLYNVNKEYFDSLPVKEYGGREMDKITEIRNLIQKNVSLNPGPRTSEAKLKENKQIQKILKKTDLKNKKQLKSALSDVKSFINKNKNKYSKLLEKGEFGIPYKFQEDLLDFIQKKYPNLISISEGAAGKAPVLPGQRLLPVLLFGEKDSKLRTTMGGEYARNTNLKRLIFKSLDLPFDLKEGTGVYNAKNYNSLVNELLPAAQEKGFIPKEYINKQGKTIKITSSNYNNYVKTTLTDPLFNVFGKQVYFSPEHTGGLTRAVALNDPKSLKKITPIQSFREEGIDFKESPNIVKGKTFDKRITGQINNIINASDKDRPKFINAANKLAKEASESFGVPQATYSFDKKNKKVITKYPKANLEDSMINKTKLAINNFIANDGINKPVFKKLPIKLQESILLIQKGENANSKIKSHLKDLKTIPGVTTADKIPRPEKALLSDKFKTAFTKGLKTTGKVIKPIGYAFGVNAVKTAITKADEQGLDLNILDKAMAFDSGDPEVALNNAKRRVDPVFAAEERAKDLAKMTDDFEEVGQSPFGKYNDQIKNIKLP
jgi:hypothetical protein